MKPFIGITPSPSIDHTSYGDFYRYCLSRTYVDAVRAAGGIPVILPTDQPDIEGLFSRLDGILLSGGGDIYPILYGDSEMHETTYGIDDDRDGFETLAFRYAAEHDVPTLCICRGIQVMAVAQGGSLTQDIATQIPNAIEHRQQNSGKMRDEVCHAISITTGNPLHAIVGGTSLMVNSFHHQAVKTPGKDLEVIATAEDGVIESLWHPGMRFGLGVEWHPEMLAYTAPEHAAIFHAFVTEAARVGVAN